MRVSPGENEGVPGCVPLWCLGDGGVMSELTQGVLAESSALCHGTLWGPCVPAGFQLRAILSSQRPFRLHGSWLPFPIFQASNSESHGPKTSNRCCLLIPLVSQMGSSAHTPRALTEKPGSPPCSLPWASQILSYLVT